MRHTLATLAAVILAALAGVIVGLSLAPADPIPLCLEDEVLTHDGTCVPLDDPGVDYVGGIGWVAPAQ